MRVTGFEKIENFRDFLLIKNRGNHSFCSFSFIAAESDDYADIQGRQAEVSDNNNVIMRGSINSVSCVSGNSENIVKVTLVSDSEKEDVNPVIRIFQKENQTYKEILDTVIKKIGYKLNIPASLKEAKPEHPVIQYNESDFSFIRRIVSEAYSEDIIVDVDDGKTIYVGFIDNLKHELNDEEIYSFTRKFMKDISEIEFAVQGSSEGQELREYIDTGKMITWKNDTYVITRVEIGKIEGVYRYKCTAVNFKGEKAKANIRCNYTFTAKVTDVSDTDNYGRIRLDFTDDGIEDMTSDGKVWINVLTPYTAKNGGFIFIPEVDDVVKAVWNGSEFFVIGCVRQEALADDYQDVKKKQIGNLYNKNICWDEEKIEITSKEATVSLLDEEINVSVGDSAINLSKDKIKVNTKKSAVEINDDIVVKTGTAHIDSDKLEEKINAKYSCESKNITLNASASATIEAKMKVSIN